MVVLATVYMFNFIDRYVLWILLPAIRDEFQVGDTLLGLLAGTAFALFYVAIGIPVARIADKVNRRNLIALALAVWSGMTALSGLAANVWQLTLARIGVGVGEAGCSPPAHSIIADLYPPEKRSSAMGLYTLGIAAGIMLAYLAGGWVAQHVGWRQALFIVGVPGLLLAVIVRFTLPEPARGASEDRRDRGQQPAFLQVMRFLASRRSFVFMALAAGLISFVGYSIGGFMPSFIERSYGLEIAVIGFWLGLINGVAGGLGFYLGGYLADRVARTGQGRAMRFLAMASLITAVLHLGVFLAPTAAWSFVLFALPALTSNFYLAPVLGQTQSLVSLRMRAVASAVMLLVINVIGLAIGPLVTGFISDVMQPAFGEDSIRYALLAVSTVLLPLAAWCLHEAGHSIEHDLARAGEHD